MTDELERLIQADVSHDATPLVGLEDAVWARVAEQQAWRRLTGVQGAAIGIALLIGATNGSLILLAPRPTPSEMSVFSVETGLAPLSTRLDR